MKKEVWKGGNMLYPVPAVMVSCADSTGRSNILTIAWAGTVCTNPPMVSISVRPERYSYDILKQSGEFVINLPVQVVGIAECAIVGTLCEDNSVWPGLDLVHITVFGHVE